MRIHVAGYKMPRVKLPRIVLGSDSDCEHDPVFDHVHERMEHHPTTWDSHMGTHEGAMAIVEMEYKELMARKAEGAKAGIKKELTDLAAACSNALKMMM